MGCGDIFYVLTPVLGPVLRFIYNLVDNYGLSIIIFSVLIKLLTLPLSVKQYKSTLAMRKMQPELEKIQKRYANDKEKLQKEQMDLYAKYDINPMAGCLPLLIQMPVLFALYRVIMAPLTYIAGLSDSVVKQIGVTLGFEEKLVMNEQIRIAELLSHEDKFALVKDIIPDFNPINFEFLGINLADKPEFSFSGISVLWIIPILAGLTAYLSMIVTNKTNVSGAQQNEQMSGMMYVMPLMSVYFCFILPCGMGIYWIISNVMAIFQQVLLTALLGKGNDEEMVIEATAVKKKKKKKK